MNLLFKKRRWKKINFYNLQLVQGQTGSAIAVLGFISLYKDLRCNFWLPLALFAMDCVSTLAFTDFTRWEIMDNNQAHVCIHLRKLGLNTHISYLIGFHWSVLRLTGILSKCVCVGLGVGVCGCVLACLYTSWSIVLWQE